MTLPLVLGGRYEVGPLIGRGGMAEVHRGVDTRLERPVAIKILRSDLARDPTFISRFRREAQSAAGLGHPSIVAIFDSGEDFTTDERGHQVPLPYIVMEVVEGETLRERLVREGTIPPAEAARITEGVLAALAFSHRRGIVHRDIKPANVMITPRGEVKVMDFGIARAVADTAATMTQTQAVVGTAQYLSPEQAQGLPVDSRTDLYSAGCLLFELIAGRPPFIGDSPVSVAYQHVGEPAQPPSIFMPGPLPLPQAYDTVALHSLAKDREHRYQSADEFRSDLAAARSGRPVSAAAAGTVAAADASGAPTAIVGAGVGAAVAAGPTTRALTRNGTAPAAQPVGTTSRSGAAAPPPGPLDTGGILGVGRPAGDRGPRRGRRGGPAAAVLTIVGIVALLLLLLAGRELISERSGPTQVAVPVVQGLTVDAARTALTTARLTPAVTNVTNATVAVGVVIDSTPKKGVQVDVGSTVTLQVSTGPGQATVPDVTGKSQADATSALRAQRITVSTQTKTADVATQDKGVVVSTTPTAGSTINLNTPVVLTLASGNVPVPDLKGKHFSVAQATLDQYRLGYDIVQVESTQLEGTVLDSTPTAGTVVPFGTKVKLTIAKPPAAATSTAGPSGNPTG